jgi:broad-specificity NMP kinase
MELSDLPRPSSNYSDDTLPEVLALLQENRAASRTLIQKMKLMVNQRLAKEITLESFKLHRLEDQELQAVLHAHHESLRAELQSRRDRQQKTVA